MRDTLVPSMPHTRDEWSTLVAILGTTISPYLFFGKRVKRLKRKRQAAPATNAVMGCANSLTCSRSVGPSLNFLRVKVGRRFRRPNLFA
jgi:Mn2+/Fe2+ NRAMP family transporter